MYFVRYHDAERRNFIRHVLPTKWFAFYTQQSKKNVKSRIEKIFHDFYFNKD